MRIVMMFLGVVIGLVFILFSAFLLLAVVTPELSSLTGLILGVVFLTFGLTGETSLIKGLKAIGHKFDKRYE